MVELPRGKVSETRRGGVGVLELLLVDMQKRSDTGYIRCEAGALGGAIGQITVRQGTPSMSLYEDAEGNVLVSHSALGALQEAASLEGSQLTRHHEIDLDRIESLNPTAMLDMEDGDLLPWGEDIEAEAWWSRRQRKRRQWKRLDAWMPEEEDTAASETELPPLPFHPGSELLPGMVTMIDSQAPDQIFALGAHLGHIGHPLLVISRIPGNRLEDDFALPISLTKWLTEKGDGEQVCKATLEDIRREIEGFLFGAQRAVIILDGLEFLVGLHGFDRTVELVRSLIDSITTQNHLLMIPADLDVFTSRQRAILLREVDVLDNSRVDHWAERPARLEGHPFCSDDWTAIEVPSPVVEVQTPPPTPEIDDSSNRWSISGVVDAWREERHSEIQAVAESTPEMVDEQTELPTWATAPSANRGDYVVEEEPESTLEPPSAPAIELIEESTEVVEKVVQPVIKKGPKSPTVNHRGNTHRKVRSKSLAKDGLIHLSPVDVGEIQTEDLQRFEKEGMDLAASRAREVEAKVVLPEEIITPRDQLEFAASRARIVEPGVHYETEPNMRVIGMGAASRAAAGGDVSQATPPLSSNKAVREASSRAQRTQHLTGRLADIEKAHIRAMSTAFTGSGNTQVTIWERLRKLESAGIDIQPIVDQFEVDPDGALLALKEAEK
ncbi:MAG: DUF835 domain-containing protein [Candidatus Thermoplasmatota archaeon]|nr:DUF835 domain-containing protein [Candidatus Thermoplasmatota archaeon]